jgi:hypothetical protein
MKLMKGTKVKHKGLEGEVVSTTYYHVVEREKYVDVYFKDIKQVKTVKVKELEII